MSSLSTASPRQQVADSTMLNRLSATGSSLVSSGAITTHYNRNDKVALFGLDCGDGVSFASGSWAAGGEYVRRLMVRNVSNNTQHVSYKLPRSKVLVMAFPDPLRLSPGMSAQLQVTFRPLVYEDVSDAIEITCDKGTFCVPVTAAVARLDVVVASPRVEFGAVPVSNLTTAEIQVVNRGGITTRFVWEVPALFSITPAEGSLEAGATARFTVGVCPTEAAWIQSSAVMRLAAGAGDPASFPVVQLLAHSMFPHITGGAAGGANCGTCRVDFGEADAVQSGGGVAGNGGASGYERVLEVVNDGHVRAVLTVQRQTRTGGTAAAAGVGGAVQAQQHPPMFTVSPASAVLEPGAAANFRVRCSPAVAGVHSCEQFDVRAQGGNVLQLAASVTCVGPRLALQRKPRIGGMGPPRRPQTVQFRDAPLGSRQTLMLQLVNSSQTQPAAYEFDSLVEAPTTPSSTVSGGCVFQLSSTRGTVTPGTTLDVAVTFAPTGAGNYHRRLAVLVCNGSPLWVDCIGTAYSPASRPFPLRQYHLDAFRLRSAALRVAAPTAILAAASAAAADNEEYERQAGRGAVVDEEPTEGSTALVCYTAQQEEAEFALQGARGPSGDRSRAATALFQELFTVAFPPRLSHTHPGPGRCCQQLLASLSSSVLDFGAAARVAVAGLTQPARRFVTLHNHSDAKVLVQWVVPPPLPPGARGQAEGGPAALRLTTNKGASSPPHVLAVTASQAAALEARGGATESSSSGLLPPPPADREWRVVPEVAEVPPHGSLEFEVLFSPRLDGVHSYAPLEAHVSHKTNRSFRLVDDATLTPPLCLPLRCMGHTFSPAAAREQRPRLVSSFGGPLQGTPHTLRLPVAARAPAGAGVSSATVYYTWALHNVGLAPAGFSLVWADGISDTEGEGAVFQVHPRAGVLPPGSFSLITCAFRPPPQEEGGSCAYSRELRILVDGQGDGGTTLAALSKTEERIVVIGQSDSPQLQLTVEGEAADASAPGSGATLYVKPTCVGICSTRRCVLRNASFVPLRFEWRVPVAYEGILCVEPAVGDIEACEEVTVEVTFAPRAEGELDVGVKCYTYQLTASATDPLLLLLAPPASPLPADASLLLLNEEGYGSGANDAGGASITAGDSLVLAEVGSVHFDAESGSILSGRSLHRLHGTPGGAEQPLGQLRGSSAGRPALVEFRERGDAAAVESRIHAARRGSVIVSGGAGAASRLPLLLQPQPSSARPAATQSPLQHHHTGHGVAPEASAASTASPPMSSCVLRVVSRATTGALTFDPPTLDLQAALVHGGTRRVFFLVNSSDCELSYRLDAVVQVQLSSLDLDANGDGIVEPSEVESEWGQDGVWGGLLLHRPGHQPPPHHHGRDSTTGPRTVALSAHLRTLRVPASHPALRLHEPSSSNGSAPRGGDGTPLLAFDPPAGVIAAHSRVRVSMSFAPQSPALYRFRVYYELFTQAVPGERGQLTDAPHADCSRSSARSSHSGGSERGGDETASRAPFGEGMRSFFPASRCAAEAAAATAESDTRDPGLVHWRTEPANGNALWCDATARGAFPTLTVEDTVQLASREALFVVFPGRATAPMVSRIQSTRGGGGPGASVASSSQLQRTTQIRPGTSPLAGSQWDATAAAGAAGGALDVTVPSPIVPTAASFARQRRRSSISSLLLCGLLHGGEAPRPASAMTASRLFQAAVASGVPQAPGLDPLEGEASVTQRPAQAQTQSRRQSLSDLGLSGQLLRDAGLLGAHGFPRSGGGGVSSSGSSTTLSFRHEFHAVTDEATGGDDDSALACPELPPDLWVRPTAFSLAALRWGTADPFVERSSSGVGGGTSNASSNSGGSSSTWQFHSAAEAFTAEEALARTARVCPASWLWAQFSLRQLNHALSARLTRADEAFNAATHVRADLHTLGAGIPLRFTPGAVGSQPQVVLLSLRNNGHVPTTWEVGYPTVERAVDPEPWVDAAPLRPPAPELLAQDGAPGSRGPPSGADGAGAPEAHFGLQQKAEEARTRDMLDRGVFGVFPRGGRLLPGQAVTVRAHYAYIEEGRHSLTVLLRIRSGKTVKLELLGRTLCEDEGALVCPTAVAATAASERPGALELQLEAVPIGCTLPPHPGAPPTAHSAPLQCILLQNPSAVPVAYVVDDFPLREASASAYGGRVFDIVRESSRTWEAWEPDSRVHWMGASQLGAPVVAFCGLLAAGGTVRLPLLFTPVEAAEYTMHLTVNYCGAPDLWESRPAASVSAPAQQQLLLAHGCYRDVGECGEDGSGGDAPGVAMQRCIVARCKDIFGTAQELVVRVKGTGYHPQPPRTGSPTAGAIHAPPEVPLLPAATVPISLGVSVPSSPSDDVPHPVRFECKESTPDAEQILVRTAAALTARAGAGGSWSLTQALASDPFSSQQKAGGVADCAGANDSSDALHAFACLSGLATASGTFHHPLEAALLAAHAAMGISAAAGDVCPLCARAPPTGAGTLEDAGTAASVALRGLSGPDAHANLHSQQSLERALALLQRVSGGASAALGEEHFADDVGASRPTGTHTGALVTSTTRQTPASTEVLAQAPSSTLPGRSAQEHFRTRLLELLQGLSSHGMLPSLFRPGAAPPLHHGAFPASRTHVRVPHHDLPESFAAFGGSGGETRVGDVPVGGVAVRLLLLQNTRPAAAQQQPARTRRLSLTAGDGSERLSAADGSITFAWDDSDPLVRSGAISFQPSSGVVPPGGQVAIRVTIKAPSDVPAVLDANVACWVGVTERERAQRAAQLLAHHVHTTERGQRQATLAASTASGMMQQHGSTETGATDGAPQRTPVHLRSTLSHTRKREAIAARKAAIQGYMQASDGAQSGGQNIPAQIGGSTRSAAQGAGGSGVYAQQSSCAESSWQGSVLNTARQAGVARPGAAAGGPFVPLALVSLNSLGSLGGSPRGSLLTRGEGMTRQGSAGLAGSHHPPQQVTARSGASGDEGHPPWDAASTVPQEETLGEEECNSTTATAGGDRAEFAREAARHVPEGFGGDENHPALRLVQQLSQSSSVNLHSSAVQLQREGSSAGASPSRGASRNSQGYYTVSATMTTPEGGGPDPVSEELSHGSDELLSGLVHAQGSLVSSAAHPALVHQGSLPSFMHGGPGAGPGGSGGRMSSGGNSPGSRAGSVAQRGRRAPSVAQAEDPEDARRARIAARSRSRLAPLLQATSSIGSGYHAVAEAVTARSSHPRSPGPASPSSNFLHADGEPSAGAASAAAALASVKLPPAPIAPLFLHVTGRFCGRREFADAHGAGSLAAFHFPPAEVTMAEVASPAAPSSPTQGARRGSIGYESLSPRGLARLPTTTAALVAAQRQAAVDYVLQRRSSAGSVCSVDSVGRPQRRNSVGSIGSNDSGGEGAGRAGSRGRPTAPKRRSSVVSLQLQQNQQSLVEDEQQRQQRVQQAEQRSRPPPMADIRDVLGALFEEAVMDPTFASQPSQPSQPPGLESGGGTAELRQLAGAFAGTGGVPATASPAGDVAQDAVSGITFQHVLAASGDIATARILAQQGQGTSVVVASLPNRRPQPAAPTLEIRDVAWRVLSSALFSALRDALDADGGRGLLFERGGLAPAHVSGVDVDQAQLPAAPLGGARCTTESKGRGDCRSGGGSGAPASLPPIEELHLEDDEERLMAKLVAHQRRSGETV